MLYVVVFISLQKIRKRRSDVTSFFVVVKKGLSVPMDIYIDLNLILSFTWYIVHKFLIYYLTDIILLVINTI